MIETASATQPSTAFTASDFLMFEDVFARYQTPCRWVDWSRGVADEGAEWITVEYDNPAMGLMFTRTVDGSYHAVDEYGEKMAEAETFAALLTTMGFMQA